MMHLLSLSQLEHKANTEDNLLALAILSKLDEEIEQAVAKATETNDADYSYTTWEVVNACQELLKADWYKLEETKFTKDKIIYMIKGLHEDTSPYNNQVKLWKYKGTDVWQIDANAGQYGEQQIREGKGRSFTAAGFKEAQQKAVELLIEEIKHGLELNID